MNNEEIKSELTARGIKFDNRLGSLKLLGLLNADKEAKGEAMEAGSGDIEPETDEEVVEPTVAATAPVEPEPQIEETVPPKVEDIPEVETAPALQEDVAQMEIEMVCNVKHGDVACDPEVYIKGKKYVLNEDTALFFKEKGWAK